MRSQPGGNPRFSAAVIMCTSRQLLSPDLAAVPPEAIGARIAELRAALGKSA